MGEKLLPGDSLERAEQKLEFLLEFFNTKEEAKSPIPVEALNGISWTVNDVLGMLRAVKESA